MRPTSCVTAGDEDGHALQSELEKFVALPLLVVSRQVILINTVRNRYDVSWRINAALQRTLVSVRIGVRRIQDWIVSSFAICRVSAIRPVESVEKCIENTLLASITTKSVV